MLFTISLGTALVAQSGPVFFDRIAGKTFLIPEMDVRDMLQDSEGFIWMATTRGLIRYDGYEMVRFLENPMDTNSLSDDQLVALAEDGHGNLWIGTANTGVLRYDKRREIFESFDHDPREPASLSDDHVVDVLVDHQDRIWVATTAGLNRFDRDRSSFVRIHYPLANGNDFRSIYMESLEVDDQGNIWVGSWKAGLFRLDPEQASVRQFQFADDDSSAITSDRIIQLNRDPAGWIWFSSGDGRINRVHARTFDIQSYTLPLTHGRDENAANIRAIQPMPDGSLWLGTIGRGLIHFAPDTGHARIFVHQAGNVSSLASNMVMALCLDRQGGLWIGHRSPGLSRLATRGANFEVIPVAFQPADGRALPVFQVTLEDRHGYIWAGAWENGLFRYDPRTGRTEQFTDGANGAIRLMNNIVWDLLEDRSGRIWIATHDGLQRYDNSTGTFENFGAEAGLRRTAVRSLLEMSDGRIAIGTFGGIHWWEPRSERIELDTTLPGNMSYAILDLFEDSRHHLWAAVLNGGLYRRVPETGRWEHFEKRRNDPNSLSSNTVWSMVEDEQGQLWFGTAGGGLNRYVPHPIRSDSATFRHWGIHNSELPYEDIRNLTLDDRGRLWLSTEGGLFAFHTHTYQFKAYHLPGPKQSLKVASRPRSGAYIYLGNDQYLYRFHPERLQRDRRSPPVYLTGLQIGGREVPVEHTFGDTLAAHSSLPGAIPYLTELELKYWQNDLNFTFAALDFEAPANNRYAYFMENYDQDTIYGIAGQRSARYANLPPGSYTLHIIAANSEGVWNREGAVLQIRIHPPWWRTTAAYLIWALLIGTGIYHLYRFHIRSQLEKVERERLEEINLLKSRLYNNITHEFRTPLTIITGIVKQLRGKLSRHEDDNLQLIQRNAHQLLQLVNQMLDLAKLDAGHLQLNYEQGEIIHYLRYLLDSFHSLAISKDIRLHFRTAVAELTMDYDAVRLMHLMNNLVSNAIKFTPDGGDVHLSISVENGGETASAGMLQIELRDTGVGIPKDKLPKIFDRFYQGDSANTRRAQGSGIGLAITAELVELMNGRIVVQSEIGQGSTFCIFLPITKRSPLRSSPYPPVVSPVIPRETGEGLAMAVPERNGEKPLLLIVEDNADLVRYLIKILNPAYQLEVAYNGQQGIDKAVKLIPDIVITDVMMPEKDGFELCHVVKQHELTSHIPIIMLTARVDVQSRLTGLRRGADAYLEKPFLEEELIVRINALLAQRMQLQAYFQAKLGIIREEDAMPASSASADAQLQREFLSKVDRLLETHLDQPELTIAQLSRELYVDSSNLYRKVKALTGLSPQQYVRSYRLKRARELLLDSPLNIQQVAIETGFRNAAYFTRIFKKEFGMPPSQFRKKHG